MKMKKRLLALLLTAALLAITPLSAMAAGYVPTAAKIQYQEDGTWKDSGESMKWTFRKNGKMTVFSNTYPHNSTTRTYSEKYSWKGDLLKNVTIRYHNGDSNYFAFSYKKKKLVSYTFATYSGGKYTSTFKWKKKKATAQYSDGGSGTLTISKKGKLTRQTTADGSYTSDTTQKYYPNGNLKSMTTKRQYSGIASVGEYIFNKKGYLKSITWSDGDKNTFSYKTKKGKVRECTVTSSLGSPYKIVYTNWKKVAHVRNTDGFGYMPLFLGWYSWNS